MKIRFQRVSNGDVEGYEVYFDEEMVIEAVGCASIFTKEDMYDWVLELLGHEVENA